VTTWRVRGLSLSTKHHCGVQGIVMAPRRSGCPLPPTAMGIKTSGIYVLVFLFFPRIVIGTILV
jgi:hypothetical protein